MELNTLKRVLAVLEDPFITREERDHLIDLAAAIRADRSTGDLLKVIPIQSGREKRLAHNRERDRRYRELKRQQKAA